MAGVTYSTIPSRLRIAIASKAVLYDGREPPRLALLGGMGFRLVLRHLCLSFEREKTSADRLTVRSI
jgi:hypothetical protein